MKNKNSGSFETFFKERGSEYDQNITLIAKKRLNA